MKRQQSTQPFVAKKDIHKFMEELEDENDSVGSRYGDAYDDLREKLGMPTQNDSSDDDSDDDDSADHRSMAEAYRNMNVGGSA